MAQQNNNYEVFEERNRNIIRKIKGSQSEEEKRKWIMLFVWCNISFFYMDKTMRNVLIDKQRAWKEVDEHCSSEQFLLGCTDADDAWEIYEKHYINKFNKMSDEECGKESGEEPDEGVEDNSDYYAGKIFCIPELYDIDVEKIQENPNKSEGRQYLDLICEKVRPLLAKENPEYRHIVLEDPGVVSGRIKEDSVRRKKYKEVQRDTFFGELEDERSNDSDDDSDGYDFDETAAVNPGKILSYSDVEKKLSSCISENEYREYYIAIPDKDFVGQIITIRPGLKINRTDNEAEKKEKIQGILKAYELMSENTERPVGDELVIWVIEWLKDENPDLHTIIMYYWERDEKIKGDEQMTYEDFHNKYYSEYSLMEPLDLAKKIGISGKTEEKTREAVRFRYKRALEVINSRVDMIKGYIGFRRRDIREKYKKYE